MKKIVFIFSITMLLALCRPNFVLAQTPIATITFLEGVSDITRSNQEPTSLKDNDSVFAGDRIRTKSYSKVQLTFIDKSVVKLAPGSCLTIEEFTMSGDQRRELAHLKLTRGKLEAIVAKTGKPETFVIDTPNAKGAVKGSDIFVSYLGGQTGVFVKEGALSLSNLALPDTKATIEKGTCAFVPFNEAPQSQRRMLDAEMLIHRRDVDRSLIKKWIPSKESSKMNAVIVAASGTVRIYKKGASDWKPVAKDDVFEEGDKLQTASDGQATIRLNNGNTLIVAGNTELGVTTLRFDAKSNNYENTFAVTKGKVGAVVEKLSKESTFQLKTPTVICGVRGTLLEAIVGDTTQVFYEGGNGVVTNPVTGQSQNVAPGENVIVDATGAISSPFITTNEQRSGLVVMQQGESANTGGLGLSDTGSLDIQTEGGLVQAQESITGADVSALTAAAQNMELASNLLTGQVGGSSGVSPGPQLPGIYYTSGVLLPFIGGGPVDVAPSSVTVILYDNYTWTATITNGHVSINNPTGVFENRNGGDILRAWVCDFPNGAPWTGSIQSPASQINGKTLTGSVGGPDVGDAGGGTGASFSGSGSGTWTP